MSFMGSIERDSESVRYIRFQSPHRNSRGDFTGVFSVSSTIWRGRAGSRRNKKPSAAANNRWYDAAYPNPSTVDPDIYDDDINPGAAAAWFKPSATHLLDRVPGYLEILSAHGIDCRALRSVDPGRVVYEDAAQIVVVPHAPEAATARESTADRK